MHARYTKRRERDRAAVRVPTWGFAVAWIVIAADVTIRARCCRSCWRTVSGLAARIRSFP